jgi:predicted phage baseplate assembly protein
LDVVDGTNNLTRSGTLEFVGLPDFALITYFGKALYWIRAIDVQDRFKPLERAIAQQSKVQQSPQTKFPEIDGSFTGLQPCAQPLQLIRSPFLSAQLRDIAPSPKFKGLFLNTTWASQAESFNEQILGSSDGTKNQTFSFFKFPVIAEEIWVNELSALSTGEREALLTQSDLAISEIKDDSGNTTAFWVRWNPVEDLLDSTATDRHYTIDRTFGLFQFGDGIEGAVPPIGVDNIRATYQAGGGSRGNAEAGSITVLKSSIGFVERVTNWEAAGGGSDTELIDQALARGSQMLKHRHRAVAAEDFERLAHLASRSIARVKCLPNFNDEGQSKTGWVTVIIVPQSTDPQPKPDPLLKQQVEIYLRDRTANVITAPRHLVVISPVYVEVSITTTLIATALETVPLVEKAAIEQLNTFLHPLLGSETGMGWDFGQLPCLSDFYGLLEAIAGLDHVQALTMTLNVPQNSSILVSTDQPLDVTLPAYILVSSGRHQVTVQGLTFS